MREEGERGGGEKREKEGVRGERGKGGGERRGREETKEAGVRRYKAIIYER